jgi:hypothetical protein
MRISLLLLAVVLSACGDGGSKVPLSPGGGGAHQVGVDHPDSGGNVDEMDAGSTPDAGDGPLPYECTRIDALMYTAADEVPDVTATLAPTDFKVTREVATWSGDCPSPSMEIALSNGICPSGQGHELVFWLPANSIADGTIALGLNQVEVEPSFNGIRVRYTRPEHYSAEGTYGACSGSAFGMINFFDPPDTTRAEDLRATYDLTLAPCDGKGNPLIEVSGVFNVRVRRTLAMVCSP